MDFKEARIIEDYALNIAHREARRHFGTHPVTSGTIQQTLYAERRRKEIYEHYSPSKEISKWKVTLVIKNKWYSFVSTIEFDFPRLMLRIMIPDSYYNPVQEYSQSIDAADPRSKREIEKFFAETFKTVKKDLKIRKYKYLLSTDDE